MEMNIVENTLNTYAQARKDIFQQRLHFLAEKNNKNLKKTSKSFYDYMKRKEIPLKRKELKYMKAKIIRKL